MDKVKMQSMDITADNIEKIGALFPEAVTEVKKDGKVTKAIDIDVLNRAVRNVLEWKISLGLLSRLAVSVKNPQIRLLVFVLGYALYL